ncbi:MAG: hypothetical protein U0599_14295 [Vicinamibacteria bacterium]
MTFRSVALAVLGVAAVTSTLVAQSNEITTTGTVVSRSASSLVVRIDDHRHRIAFDVDAATALPEGLAAGARVSVVYHPTGSVGQKADRVTILSPAPEKPRASAARAGKPGA